VASIARHLLVVAAGHRRRLVPLEAEVTHLRRGNEGQERVEHPEAGAKHRHRHDPLAETKAPRPLERRFDLGLDGAEPARRLGDEEEAQAMGEPAELRGGRPPVA
jgi:hypothetical protein